MALLLVGGAAGLVWRFAPADAAADVWNVSQALLSLVLLAFVAAAWRSVHVTGACLLLASWQALVAGCSIAYLATPWPVAPGGEQCSAKLDAPIGLIAAWLLMTLAIGIYLDRRRHGDH